MLPDLECYTVMGNRQTTLGGWKLLKALSIPLPKKLLSTSTHILGAFQAILEDTSWAHK
jgi:hypothetical protein